MKTIKTGLWRWLPALGGLALAMAIMPNAGAQCGVSLKPIKPMSWHPLSGNARLMAAAFSRGADDEYETPSIVGMWHVTFTAKTANGSVIGNGGMVIDDALVVWHSDGTEIMNSARPPQDGDFCLGVWQQTGTLSYRLNHFAWAANNYTPGDPQGSVGAPIGGVHITEQVTLGPLGKHFSGTFKLDQFDTSGNIGPSFTGIIKADRITMDTTINDLL
jgi:hypothetical protein